MLIIMFIVVFDCLHLNKFKKTKIFVCFNRTKHDSSEKPINDDVLKEKNLEALVDLRVYGFTIRVHF